MRRTEACGYERDVAPYRYGIAATGPRYGLHTAPGGDIIDDREYLIVTVPAALYAALRARGGDPRGLAERAAERALRRALAVPERVYQVLENNLCGAYRQPGPAEGRTRPMIPQKTWAALIAYTSAHHPTGDGLRRVLENDLCGAYRQLDPENLAALHAILIWLHWDVPAACWGSPAKVAAWLEPEAGDDA